MSPAYIPKIQKKSFCLRHKKCERVLKKIIPEANAFNEKRLDKTEYFEALNGGEIIGYCIKVVARGYGGPIVLEVGIDVKGVIKGAEIIRQNETPVFADNIKEMRPGEKEPWFLKQFKDKRADTIKIKSDIDAITGATISSQAVTDGIRKAVKDFLIKVENKEPI